MRKILRRFVSVLLFLSLSAGLQLWAESQATSQAGGSLSVSASTKQDAELEAPTFSSRSQLVLVPVVVTGKDGKHLSGLGREAFKIEEQGKVRESTIFEEVTTVAPDAKAHTIMPAVGHSNFDYADTKDWRMTVVVMDTLNTPFLSQGEGRRQLIQYLAKSLQRDEPTALFGLGQHGLRQIHSFTKDTAVLLEALKKVQGQVSADEVDKSMANITSEMADLVRENATAATNQTAQNLANFMNDSEAITNAFQQRESIRITLTAMIQLAHAYSTIPGRKTLIWASGGFPFMIDDPQAFARMGFDMTAKYEETWRALMAANIAVYTVDVAGLSGAAGIPDASQGASVLSPVSNVGVTSYNRHQEQQTTLRAFSEATGGIACVNSNDLEKCFAQAIDDSRSYYMLGYYLPSGDEQPGWRKLKVKVAVSGAHARAREGFYVGAPVVDTPESRRLQTVDALASPVEFTGIRMNIKEVPVGVNMKPIAAGKAVRDFIVSLPGDSITVDVQNQNLVDITFVTVALTYADKNVGLVVGQWTRKLTAEALQDVRQQGMAMRQSMELAPGKYKIRVAARDNLNGEVGSVEYPIEVK